MDVFAESVEGPLERFGTCSSHCRIRGLFDQLLLCFGLESWQDTIRQSANRIGHGITVPRAFFSARQDCGDGPQGIEFLYLTSEDECAQVKIARIRGVVERCLKKKPAGPHARPEQWFDLLLHELGGAHPPSSQLYCEKDALNIRAVVYRRQGLAPFLSLLCKFIEPLRRVGELGVPDGPPRSEYGCGQHDLPPKMAVLRTG
jgi:hypothetical protein